MTIIISNSSPIPIYEQIVAQVREQIASGALREGEALPSVRALAAELRISALTVKKAYDALEREGTVVTSHGKGSFVSGNTRNTVMEDARREAELEMERAVAQARRVGMTDGELRRLLDLLLEE